jgi:hypothetical protein
MTVLDKVDLLLLAETEAEGTIVVVHDIAQCVSAVVEEAAFLVREETMEQLPKILCSVLHIGRRDP